MDSLDSFPNLQDSKRITINDYIIDYLLESNKECFKFCVKDFKSIDLNKSELDCVSNCYSKYFSSFIITTDKINNIFQ